MTATFSPGRDAHTNTQAYPQRAAFDRTAGGHQCRACGSDVPVLIFFDTRRRVYCRPACWEAMND